jgi:hypothetical protein
VGAEIAGETSSDLILKTCSRFPPPRTSATLRDVIWRVFQDYICLSFERLAGTAAPHPAPQSA